MKTRENCRVCGGAFDFVMSLGDHYVSDFVTPDDQTGIRAPLELVLCQQCQLLQLKHTVPADQMYRNYWYRSGTNRTMTEALADIANKSEVLMHLTQGDAVLDIGCNDGTLLAAYKTAGIMKIGFDPAQNLLPFSQKVADKVLPTFFNAQTVAAEPSVRAVRPKVITSIAMFYDLEEPNQFVADIKKVMHPEGLWIIQMSYLPLMIKQNAFDNICHEHLEYYSLHSLEQLLQRHDFEVVDVELNDVNGGSFRVYIRNRSAGQQFFGDETFRRLAAERVGTMRRQEQAMGLQSKEAYQQFAMWTERIKDDVSTFIEDAVRRGKKVWVYGASTKGNTLLQYCNLTPSMITAAAERNSSKWGRVTVGTRIPIVSEEDARHARPDYMLVLPWHFLDEFMQREKAYLNAGGRFIIPMPHFALI